MSEELKMGVNVGRKTTQINLWMIVGIVLFIVISGIFVARYLRNPPSSTEEMKQGSFLRRGVWAKAIC